MWTYLSMAKVSLSRAFWRSITDWITSLSSWDKWERSSWGDAGRGQVEGCIFRQLWWSAIDQQVAHFHLLSRNIQLNNKLPPGEFLLIAIFICLENPYCACSAGTSFKLKFRGNHSFSPSPFLDVITENWNHQWKQAELFSIVFHRQFKLFTLNINILKN